MDNLLALGSNVVVRVRHHPSGLLLAEHRLHNLVTDDGLSLLSGELRGATDHPQLLYVGVGDDPTAPTAGDSALGNELARKRITTQSEPAVGKATTTVFYSPAEANHAIEEIGWFAGDATEAADSGALFARVLYSHVKDTSETLEVVRTDTIART